MPPKATLQSIGEFGLIELLAQLLPAAQGVDEIGDDAAVLPFDEVNYLLATVDMMVEDVHFSQPSLSAFDLGRRAVAVNLSDVAAMGGEPTYALVSFAALPNTHVEFVQELYRGMLSICSEYGTAIVGGNVSRTSGPFTLDIVVLGRVPRDQVLFRRGGQPGDLLVVTGELGSATASRLVRERPAEFSNELVRFAARHAVPVPRVVAARELARSGLVHAMMDVSDGLASDARHMAEASSVAMTIFEASLPIAPETVSVSVARGIPITDIALSGGEDYELLLAIAPHDFERIRATVKSVQLSIVGSLHSGESGCSLLRIDGSVSPLEPTGWAHF